MFPDSVCLSSTQQLQIHVRLRPTTCSFCLWLHPCPTSSLISYGSWLWSCPGNSLPTDIEIQYICKVPVPSGLENPCNHANCSLHRVDSSNITRVLVGVLSTDWLCSGMAAFTSSSQVTFSELGCWGTFRLAPPDGVDVTGVWLAAVWLMSNPASPWVSCSRLLSVWLDNNIR